MKEETLLTVEIGMLRSNRDRDVNMLRRVIAETASPRRKITDTAALEEEYRLMHLWGVHNHVLDCCGMFRMMSHAYGGRLVLMDKITVTHSAYLLGLNDFYPEQLSPYLRYDMVLPDYYVFLFNKRRTEDFTNAVKSLEGAVVDRVLPAGVNASDTDLTFTEEKITVAGIPVKGEMLRLVTENAPVYRTDRFPVIGTDLLKDFLSACCDHTKREKEKACSFLEQVRIGDLDDLEAFCGLLQGSGNLEAAEALMTAGLDWRMVSTRDALGKCFSDGGDRKADALRRCMRRGELDGEGISILDELRIPENIRETIVRIRYIPNRCYVLPLTKALFRAGREKESIERLMDLCPTYDEDYEAEEDVLADIPETRAGLNAVREYLKYYDGSVNARYRLREIRKALGY